MRLLHETYVDIQRLDLPYSLNLLFELDEACDIPFKEINKEY